MNVGRSDEDDREAVDRTFAEMMAGFHLTAERPEVAAEPAAPAPAAPPAAPDSSWADHHPLFRMVEPAPAPTPEPREAVGRYVPDPLPPLQRPGLPALLGWVGIGYAVLMVLIAAIGVPLPSWTGWLAVSTFIAGFVILITRLPRNRPPDAGDGAVL